MMTTQRLINFIDSLYKRLMYRLKLRTKSKHVAAFLLRNSLIKVWNLIRVSVAERLGETHNFGYPYILTMEPTNRCNLKCPLCPTGKGLVGRPIQSMAQDAHHRIIDEIGKYVYVINYQNWGEPTLAKELPKLIRYSHEHNIFTCLATNGHYKRALNDSLLESHLDHITFAVDGSDNETYSKYRHGGKLSLVIQNIRDLLQKRDQENLRYPFVELQFLVFEHNLHDLNKIQTMARGLKVDGLLVRAGEGPENESVLRQYYTWDTQKNFCSRFWYTATIASDGGVVPCCNYYYQCDDFGNISNTSFSDVWNNANFRQSRENVANKSIPQLHSVCRNCKIYNSEQKNFPIWHPNR